MKSKEWKAKALSFNSPLTTNHSPLLSTMKAKKRTCLQITYGAVRRADMVWRDGRWVCVEEDSRPLPPVEGVSDPLSHPRLEDTVRQLLASAKPRQVYISLSCGEALLRRIELPEAVPQAASDLQSAAIRTVLENEDYIPVPLDSAAYDFQLMSAGTLLVGWMRRERLTSLSEGLCGPVCLTPQSVTLANQLLSEGAERVCGAYIVGASCDLAVVEAGEFRFGRSFCFGNHAQLAEAVRQSLAACPNPTGTALKQIVLFGEWAESVAEQLGTLGVEVTCSSFDWAAALLNPSRQETGIRLNLLAPLLAERAARHSVRRKRRLMRLIPITALILLLAANVYLFDAVKSKRAHIASLRLERAQLNTLQTETKSLQKRHAALEWGERRFPPLSERLVHIADRCPGTIRLTEIKTLPPPRGARAQTVFDARRVLQVVGIASSQAEINAFRAALVTRSEFSSVRQIKTEQITIGGARRLEFTLAMKSSGLWSMASDQ